MRFKSKFSISAILVAALLALLSVVPALGGSQTVGEVKLEVQGGSGTAAAFKDITQDTRVGTTLYASNDVNAYNRVVMTVTHAAANTATGTRQHVEVTVSNSSTGSSLGKLYLQETGNNTGIFGGSTQADAVSIFTVGTTTNVSSRILGASEGNQLRVTYNSTPATGYLAGTGAVGKIAVDATKPTISSISPATGGTLRPGSVDFSASITDAASGIRSDAAPLPGADGPGTNTNDSLTADGDADGITSSEPRTYGSNANEKDFASTPDVGTTVDIHIYRAGAATPAAFTVTASSSPLYGFAMANDFSESALWSAVSNGFTFSATVSPAAGTHRWGVVAKDRVGNTSFTDSTAVTAGSQTHLLVIDGTAPAMGLAETGKSWSAVTTEEGVATNRKYIKVSWTSAGATPTGTAAVPTNNDNLNTSTVQASDFAVLASATSTTALPIASIVHPNLKLGTGSVKPSLETRHIVYIELASELTSSAKPLVKFVGSVTDLAGNAAATHQIVATDAIPPKLTVTITGAASDPRPIAKGTTTATNISISVVSDEVLSGTPTIYLMNLATSTGDVAQVGTGIVTVASPTPVTTTSWSTTAGNGTVGAGLVNVVVRATDANSVKGVSGSGGTAAAAPSAANNVNLAGAHLFSFDNTSAAASLTLTPAKSGTTTTTESSSPFIRVDFSEGKENLVGLATTDKWHCGAPSVGAAPICKPFGATGVGNNPSIVEHDAHNAITLNLLTLDGVSVLGTQGTVDPDSFVLATSGLAVGTHTVTFNGTDAVGNTYAAAQSFTFTVAARSAYSVPVSPGWNLISLPGDPADTSIDAVIPATHPATQVLSYAPADANGPWLVATRAAGEAWAGTLTTIDSSGAYWVKTGAFTAISTLIPERDPAAVLPTIPVVVGWNLVPVVDLQTTAAPTQATLAARTAGIDPDLYFSSITWTVVYGFDTQGNAWRKITPAATVDNVGTGKGYWVWATKAGTLVP